MNNEQLLQELISLLSKLLYYETYNNVSINNSQYDYYVDNDGFVHVRNVLTIDIDYDNIYLKRLNDDKNK